MDALVRRHLDAAPNAFDALPTGEKVFQVGLVVLLVLLAALFSGLTLGLMCLDKFGLQIVVDAGEDPHATDDEKTNAKYAKKIQKVRKDGHLLLTSLLIANVSVSTILSILLADMTSGVTGFLISTVVLVLFGELLPQALCSRHPLYIGAKSLPIVWFFVVALYVISKPIALCLDWLLGREIGNLFSKREIGKMLDIHVKQNMLDPDETDIMRGALHFKSKVVAAVMTPIDKVYSLPTTTKLDLATIRHIYQQGYSRIPVYHKDINDIVGLIFVKDLIFADPSEATTLLHFVHVFGRGVHRVWPDSTLGDVLQAFKMGRTHLALVHDVNNAGPGDPFYETKGIATLEDIVEEILQADIYDESDQIDADVTRKNRLSHRSYDTGVGRVLQDTMHAKKLAKPEADALAKHLVAVEPVFRTAGANGAPIDVNAVSALLCQSHLLEFRTEESPHAELMTEGQATNDCFVVLQGHVNVTSHSSTDGARTAIEKRGLWSLLGAHALLELDAESDMTVDIPSDEYVRCLRISRLDFQATLFPMHIVEQPAVLAERRLEIQVHAVPTQHGVSSQAAPILVPPSPAFHSDLDQSSSTVPYTLDARESM